MKKTISTELTQANMNKVLDLLAATAVKLENVQHRLSSEQLRHSSTPNDRSIIGILAHLLNCEAITADSIYLALLIDEPLLFKIHAERDLGKLLCFDQLEFGELLLYFKVRRTLLLHILRGLSDEQWMRTVREEGKQRKESVYWRARGQALHEAEHLAEIERRVSSWSIHE